MAIVVTGGTGYIGSHTCVELLNEGYDVIILDNLSNSDISMVDRIAQISGSRPIFEKVDMKSRPQLVASLSKYERIDAIIHFAALKSVGESVKMPIAYYENNVTGLLNLLDIIKDLGLNNLVFSSSATVYGSPDDLPVTEKTPIGYTPSPYGATKQMCERIIEDFTYAQEDFSAISLRYFNPIGAHKSGIIGELPTGIPNNLMPYITQTAAGLRKELSVYGSDYNTSDGTAIRDYIHVVDVAKAHVKAVEYLLHANEKINDKINIGTGRGSTVLEVIRSFESTNKVKLPYKMADRREGDVESVYADVDKAKRLLKWTAQYQLDDMTRSAWQWEKNLRNIES